MENIKNKAVSGIMLTLLLGIVCFPLMLVGGEPVIHDLEVDLKVPLKGMLEDHLHLKSESSTTLNVTVKNNGEVDEFNVTLQLLVNGTVYLNSTTPKLSRNKIFWSAYWWSPADGIWNLTAYAPPKGGESNPANNNKTKWVNVCQDKHPIANFTPPPLPIQGEYALFNASASHDPDWGNITSYEWSFNGTPRTSIGPFYNYPFPKWGFANVTLTLHDTENLSNSTSTVIRVYARPEPDFTVEGWFYVGYALTFNASKSSDPDRAYPLSYTWNFGDGNITPPMSESVITHIYDNEGKKTVQLTVTDNDNLNKSMSQQISIGSGIPKARFEITAPRPLPGPYYVNETLTFDASKSQPAGKPIINYTWNFDDGTTDTGNVTYHAFSKAKIYNVMLTVIDDMGLKGNITKPVDIRLPIHMRVEPKQVKSDPEKTFDVNITIVNVEDLKSFEFKLFWPAEWLPPKYYLLDYQTTLEGNFLRSQRYPNGTERWRKNYVSEGEGYLHVNYSFTSVVPKEERSGNGTLVIIRFLVMSSGNATLHLDNTILLDSLTNRINHSTEDGYFYTTKPVANFTHKPEPATVNHTVTFNASTSYDPDGGSITYYEWDFGDKNETGTFNSTIIHCYNNTGTFNVTLTVTDDELNESSITYPVKVVSGRDVAVISIEPCELAFNETSGMYEMAGKLPINVTVKNKGSITESFTVTVYYKNTTGLYSIDAKSVPNLHPNENRTLTFDWSISNVAKGIYIIVANASRVPDEEDLHDNYLENGKVKVHLPGDVDHNDKVDIFDVVKITDIYYKRKGDPEYNRWADLNCDGIINIFDLVICTGNYGKKDP
jgi:PKD repeat protein